MAWMLPHSAVKKKFSTVWSPGKVMATVFWDVYGVLLVDITPSSSTINAAAYQETLKRLKEAIQKKRPVLLTTVLLLLHDNARPHRAAATMSLLNPWCCEILPHPQYSPDMAPSDFHLFPKRKGISRGQQFHSSE
jgi:histone-lysine N-methyltransferase SETMAR